jgi:hypothetical protein
MCQIERERAQQRSELAHATKTPVFGAPIAANSGVTACAQARMAHVLGRFRLKPALAPAVMSCHASFLPALFRFLIADPRVHNMAKWHGKS